MKNKEKDFETILKKTKYTPTYVIPTLAMILEDLIERPMKEHYKRVLLLLLDKLKLVSKSVSAGRRDTAKWLNYRNVKGPRDVKQGPSTHYDSKRVMIIERNRPARVSGSFSPGETPGLFCNFFGFLE
jgi:hypothetical protein